MVSSSITTSSASTSGVMLFKALASFFSGMRGAKAISLPQMTFRTAARKRSTRSPAASDSSSRPATEARGFVAAAGPAGFSAAAAGEMRARMASRTCCLIAAKRA